MLAKEAKSLIETFEKRRRTIENIQSSIREEQIQGENAIEKRRQLEGELSLLEDRRKFYDILIREGTELFAMFKKHFKENGKDIVHEVSQSAFEDIKFEISKRRRLRVASSNNFSREKHSLSERSSPVSRKRLRRMQDDATSLSSMQSFGNDFDVEEKTDDGDGANTFFSIQRFEHELDMEVDSNMEVKCGDDDDDDDDNDDDDNGKNGNEIRSVESVLPRINQSQCKEVEEMRKNEEVDVIVTKYKVAMKRKKWMCLRGSEWLNDEVINFYMEILKEKSTDIFLWNSFFFSKLAREKNGYKYANVQRWTRGRTRSSNINLFEKRIIFVPINEGNVHWVCAAIFMKEKVIRFYDSQTSTSKIVKNKFENLLRYLADEWRDKNDTFNLQETTEWTLETLKNKWKYETPKVPRQENGNDCGAFVCAFATCLSLNLPFQFSQKDIPNFRKYIAYSIMSSTSNDKRI